MHAHVRSLRTSNADMHVCMLAACRSHASQMLGVEVVQVSLVELTRDAAAAWMDDGSIIAVVDTGHHSCLAAAIRLSAVYRMPRVVLLQLNGSDG